MNGSMGSRMRWVFFLLTLSGAAIAGDLDDGISLDEPIDDELKTSPNIPYILMKAKAGELRGKGTISDKNSAVVGQGNIIIGPGTRLPPGTIIINNSDIDGATAVSR